MLLYYTTISELTLFLCVSLVFSKEGLGDPSGKESEAADGERRDGAEDRREGSREPEKKEAADEKGEAEREESSFGICVTDLPVRSIPVGRLGGGHGPLPS